jgi:hypothetical protein
MNSPSRALEASFGPILSEPIVVDQTASLTPGVLVTDLVDPSHHRVRRVMIYNADTTYDVTLLIVPAGSSLTGKTAADGLRVPPYQFRQVVVSSALRLGVVASGGTPAFNAIITDT